MWKRQERAAGPAPPSSGLDGRFHSEFMESNRTLSHSSLQYQSITAPTAVCVSGDDFM